MDITLEQLFKNSFVLTADDERLDLFKKIFEYHNLSIPRCYKGFQFKRYYPELIGKNEQNIPVVLNCSYGHASIIKLAQYLDLPFVCIFEDDAYPCFDIKSKLEQYLKDIPDDADCLLLGNIGGLKASKYNDKFITLLNYGYGAHAYIVFKNGYEKILANYDNISSIADHAFFKLKCYSADKNLFIQYELKTSIHGMNEYQWRNVSQDKLFEGFPRIENILYSDDKIQDSSVYEKERFRKFSVLYTFDNNKSQADKFRLSLKSLVKNTNDLIDVDIYVLLPKNNPYIQSFIKIYDKIKFIYNEDIDQYIKLICESFKKMNNRWGFQMFYKFYLFNKNFYEKYDRCLYLDTDVIIKKDIHQIFNEEYPNFVKIMMMKEFDNYTYSNFIKKFSFLGNNKPEYATHQSFFCSSTGLEQKFKTGRFTYCNSGVILFNSKNCNINIFNKLVKLAEKNNKVQFPDQDLLNILISMRENIGLFQELQKKYNKIEQFNEDDVIRHYFGNKKMEDITINNNGKIDYVFPYCNFQDEEWQKSYDDYLKSQNIERPKDFYERHVDNLNIIKYSLRSIDKYLPWINNVYLVVNNKSSVPNWINTDKIKIITIDQILPKEMIPCFNSIAIEHYISRIPGLSEKFLYGNDDFLALKPLTEEMFFTNGGKLNISIHKLDKKRQNQFYMTILNNSWKFLYKKYNKSIPKDIQQYGYEQLNVHAFRPNLKSVREKILIECQDEIIKTFSRIRKDNNITNLEIPYYYLNRYMVDKICLPNNFHIYTSIKNDYDYNNFLNIINNRFYTTVINYCDDKQLQKVKKLLDKKFDFKSKYEK